MDAEYRKQGVFRALFTQVVNRGREDSMVKGVRLYVEKENFSAQSVYEKLGMTKYDDWAFDEKDFIFSH